MTEIFIIIILIPILLIATLLLYLLGRNNKVLIFNYYITNISYEYNLRRITKSSEKYDDAFDWFANKWTYNQMLYSFKPLKLENWFTKEELEEIKR